MKHVENACPPRDFIIRYALDHPARSIYVPPHPHTLPNTYLDSLDETIRVAPGVPIESLELSHTPLPQDRFFRLLDALQAHRKHLRQLQFQQCALGDGVVSMLLVFLQECSALTHLMLSWNVFTLDGEASVTQAACKLAEGFGKLYVYTIGHAPLVHSLPFRRNRVRNTLEKNDVVNQRTVLFLPSHPIHARVDASSSTSRAECVVQDEMPFAYEMLEHGLLIAYHNVLVDYELSVLHLQLCLLTLHRTTRDVLRDRTAPPIECILRVARILNAIEEQNRDLYAKEAQDEHEALVRHYLRRTQDLHQRAMVHGHAKQQHALFAAERHIRGDVAWLERTHWKNLRVASLQEKMVLFAAWEERMLHLERIERKSLEGEALGVHAWLRNLCRCIRDWEAFRGQLEEWERISRQDLRDKMGMEQSP